MSTGEDVTLGLVGGKLSPENLAAFEDEAVAGRAISVRTEAGYPAAYVSFGPGRAVPMSIEYAGSRGKIAWQMTVQVMGGGQARCVRLLLDAAKGAYVDAKALRAFPLGEKTREALLLFAVEIDDNGRPIGPPIRERVTTLSEARSLHRTIEREHHKRQRGARKTGRVTDEKLREAARVYRESVSTGRPTAAVAAHFTVSRPTAGRWVVTARRRGYLGGAPGPGRAGEVHDGTQEGGGG